VRTFAIVTLVTIFVALTAFFVIDTYRRIQHIDERVVYWRERYRETQSKLDWCKDVTENQEWRPCEEMPDS
jgi:hypothetical protein